MYSYQRQLLRRQMYRHTDLADRAYRRGEIRWAKWHVSRAAKLMRHIG